MRPLLAGEQVRRQRAARLHPACAPARHSPPTPAFSFFLPRPLGVFGICIFSAFSTSATELTPDSGFLSRSVLESPWREEEGCAHSWGGQHPLLSEERWEASRRAARSLAAPPPSDANFLGNLGGAAVGRKWQRDLRLGWGGAQTQILPSACQARPRLILSALRSGYHYPRVTGEDTEVRG